MAPADEIEDAEPRLARERTDLAWTRTGISFTALGCVIVKNAPVAGIVILTCSLLIWRLGHLARDGETGPARARRPRLIALSVTGIALVALVLALLGPGTGGSWLSRATRPGASGDEIIEFVARLTRHFSIEDRKAFARCT